jgi:fatty-acyl-CoA synthase/long-chain acyl-CoA synthetase
MAESLDRRPLGAWLEHGASEHPQRPLLSMPGESWTYAEVLAESQKVARGLHALGVGPGDHVGILIPNSIQLVAAMFGATLLGAVFVPINARYRSIEFGYVIDNADLKVILTSDLLDEHVDFSVILRDALPGLPADHAPAELQLTEAPALRHIVMLHGDSRPGYLGRGEFDRGAAAAGSPPEPSSEPGPRSPACILYTSGTTANPKGCVISHEALTRGCRARIVERLDPGPADVHWSAGPLFHIGSLQVFLGCLVTGGSYLTDVRFDARAALDLMVQHRVVHAWPWFPAVIQDIIALEGFEPEQLRSMRTLMLSWPEPLRLAVQDLFPWIKLFGACGMTETAGSYATNRKDDSREERAAANGTPFEEIEVKVIDPDTGEALGYGEAGELLVRGYCVMDGYYKDPEKTAQALDPEGWLHTGDVYARTESGQLIFRTRLKDMLKVGGENVAAVEIEAVVMHHPEVRTAEVVGAPDPRLDEVPVAFVELEPGSTIAEAELIEACRGTIASYKVPRRVHFVEPGSWPMSATKVDKNALRKRAVELEAATPQMTR